MKTRAASRRCSRAGNEELSAESRLSPEHQEEESVSMQKTNTYYCIIVFKKEANQ